MLSVMCGYPNGDDRAPVKTRARVQCGVTGSGQSSAMAVITTVTPDTNNTISGRLPACRMRAQSRSADNVIPADKLDAVIGSSMGNNIVHLQRSPDALERHLGDGLDQNSALDRKEYLRTDQDLPGLRFVAQA
jgi:hypothetical protein